MVSLAHSSTMPAHDVECAMTLARIEAFRRIRLGRFAAPERDDLIQDLLVGVVSRWRRFDSHRAKFATFFSLVVRREATSISRSQRAVKRGSGRAPLSLVGHAAGSDDLLSHTSGADDFARSDLRNDVRVVVAGLPSDLQPLAWALMTESPTAAARSLSIPRQVASAQMRQVRKRFEAAGFGPRPSVA